jgi:hypothetical protein
VLVDHLRHSVAKQDDVLVKRLDVALQFDAVHEVDGHRHVLFAEQVQKWILQELTFVAHDIFPC